MCVENRVCEKRIAETYSDHSCICLRGFGYLAGPQENVNKGNNLTLDYRLDFCCFAYSLALPTFFVYMSAITTTLLRSQFLLHPVPADLDNQVSTVNIWSRERAGDLYGISSWTVNVYYIYYEVCIIRLWPDMCTRAD